MRNARTTRRAWIILTLGVVGLAVASACAPKAARRQTDVMEKAGTVSVSAAEASRARVDDLADLFVGRLEETADRIQVESQDRGVRRNALAFKIEGVPAVYTAAYRGRSPRRRPGHVGAGVPGRPVPRGRRRPRRLRAPAAAGPREPPASAARRRRRVDPAASRRGPVDVRPGARPGGALGDRAAPGRSARSLVAPVDQPCTRPKWPAGASATPSWPWATARSTLESLSERLNTYAAELPKQARWQAELLVSSTRRASAAWRAALGDVHAVGTAARARERRCMGDVPGLRGRRRVCRCARRWRRSAGPCSTGVNGQRLERHSST